MKTDEEVIKGLKCCCRPCCSDCPYQGSNCIKNMVTDALNLLTKQKSEFEKLQDIYEYLQEIYNNNMRCIDRYKEGAVREFAERLKEKRFYPFIESDLGLVSIGDIDNLVKEMVGEDK